MFFMEDVFYVSGAAGGAHRRVDAIRQRLLEAAPAAAGTAATGGTAGAADAPKRKGAGRRGKRTRGAAALTEDDEAVKNEVDGHEVALPLAGAAGGAALPPVRGMREARVGALALRLGARYLYRHHLAVPEHVDQAPTTTAAAAAAAAGHRAGAAASNGAGAGAGAREVACEHFVYVTDLRLHTNVSRSVAAVAGLPDGAVGNGGGASVPAADAAMPAALLLLPPQRSLDPPLRSAYPRRTFQARRVYEKCGVCRLWGARYEVHGDRLVDKVRRARRQRTL